MIAPTVRPQQRQLAEGLSFEASCPFTTMSSLPGDIYFEIAPHSTARTLVTLCLCSRAWHIAASSVLYRDIRHFRTDQLRASAYLLRSIASNKRIGRLVQRLHIYCSYDDAVQFMSGAIRNMPNLRCLRARYLGSVIKEDRSCVEALVGLKQLDGLSCNLLRDDVVFHRLGPLRHIQITGDAGRVSSSPVPVLESLIIRSHNTLSHLDLPVHLLTRIMDGIPNSAVFTRLQTIVLDDHKLPLFLLLGHRFPALETIKAEHLGQQYLLHDPGFLPGLQILHFACMPDSDPSTKNYTIGGTETPSLTGRKLLHLELDIYEMSKTFESDSVDRFCSLIEPFTLGDVSSLTLVGVRDVQSPIALSALRRHLTQGNNLRVICIELRMSSLGAERVSLLLSVKLSLTPPQSVQRLRDIAEDGLLSNVVYLRLQTGFIVQKARVVFGNVLRRTSARAGHYRAAIREVGGMLRRLYISWTRAGEGDGWAGSWSAISDEQDKLPWPDYLLNLHSRDLLVALGLRE